MSKHRRFSDVSEQYFRDRPEEVDAYVSEIFSDYADDHDMGVLLSQLRVVVRARGLSHLAEEIGMTRAGLQKALSEDGNPRLDTMTDLMHALGYRLMPEPVVN